MESKTHLYQSKDFQIKQTIMNRAWQSNQLIINNGTKEFSPCELHLTVKTKSLNDEN